MWPIKVLREKTQQPESYLKETLQEIASLHRSGEHTGMWELNANFKGDGVGVVLVVKCWLVANGFVDQG